MSPATKGSGILLRICNPELGTLLDPRLNVPGAEITKITTVMSEDDKMELGAARAGVVYYAKHISRFLLDGSYEKDPAHSNGSAMSLDWLVYKKISELSREGYEDKDHGITAPGSAMICVAISPKDSEEYSKWYDNEHVGMISKVPGWIKSERYELAKAYGSQIGAAPFMAMHFYDEKNGLGGPEWKASINTERSKNIRENAIVPHYRRVWRVLEQNNVAQGHD